MNLNDDEFNFITAMKERGMNVGTNGNEDPTTQSATISTIGCEVRKNFIVSKAI